MYCSKCGEQLASSANFCSVCGFAVNRNYQQKSAPVSQQSSSNPSRGLDTFMRIFNDPNIRESMRRSRQASKDFIKSFDIMED